MIPAPTNIDFPWAVAGDLVEHKAYRFQTELGDVGIFHALFACGTNVMALLVPGGAARFARLAGETNWALEERRSDVDVPETIREKVDQAWRQLMDAMAEANRLTREEEQRGEMDLG